VSQTELGTPYTVYMHAAHWSRSSTPCALLDIYRHIAA